MRHATHDDIVRLFPGIPDHMVVALEATQATIADLEAAALLLQGEDESLLDYQRQNGDHLNNLLTILADWEAPLADDSDR